MNLERKSLTILSTLALTFTVITTPVNAQDSLKIGQKNKRPNILLIVADDMGYSDLGSYGGEIKTPVLDQLAQQGVRYTDFYVSPTCSVTRSMLLSGTDNHVAGLGSMGELTAPNQVGMTGYEGVLNKRVASVAELLRDNGYHTYMAGKWHLGLKPDQIPHARGFERDFSTLVGGGSHFDNGWNVEWQIPKMPYTEDGRPVKQLPKDFYSTKTYTDKTIQFIEEGRKMVNLFLPTWLIRLHMDRCKYLMTGCAATRIDMTKVGMGSANNALSVCSNSALLMKESMPLTACISCQGPPHLHLRYV